MAFIDVIILVFINEWSLHLVGCVTYVTSILIKQGQVFIEANETALDAGFNLKISTLNLYILTMLKATL